MLTRASRPLCAVRAFILAPPICTAKASTSTSHSTVPSWSLPSPRHPKSRRHPGVGTHSRRISTSPENPPNSIPYALTAAAHAFEEQVQRGELDFLAQTYSHLRQVMLEAHRRGLTFSNDSTSPRVLREPEVVLKGAMALLVTSPQREHADLHLTIFNDLVPVFQVRSEVDQPLEFSAQTFHAHLRNDALEALPRIYDHMCHLFDAAPQQSEVFASERSAWRVGLWMKGLAKHPQRKLANLLPRILHDLSRVFHMKPTLLHHQLVIKGFLVRDMAEDAWNWLRQMELHATLLSQSSSETPSLWSKLRSFSGLGDVKPSVDTTSPTTMSPSPNVWVKPLSTEYDLLLKYFAKRGDVVSARMLIAHMSAAGGVAAPSKLSWHILLSAVLTAPNQDTARVKAVVEEMESAGHAVHLKTLGGIAGRGPVKAWLKGEVFDALRAAQARSHTQEGDEREDAPAPAEVETVARRGETTEVTPARETSSTVSKTPLENRNGDTIKGRQTPSVAAAPASVAASKPVTDNVVQPRGRREAPATTKRPRIPASSTQIRHEPSVDAMPAPVTAGGAKTAQVSLSHTNSRPGFKMFLKKRDTLKGGYKAPVDGTSSRAAAVQNSRVSPSQQARCVVPENIPPSHFVAGGSETSEVTPSQETSEMASRAVKPSSNDDPPSSLSHGTPSLVESRYLPELSDPDIDGRQFNIALSEPVAGPEPEESFSIDSEKPSGDARESVPPDLQMPPIEESFADTQDTVSMASDTAVSLSERLQRRVAVLPSQEISNAALENIESLDPPEPSDLAQLERIDGGEFGIAQLAPHTLSEHKTSVDLEGVGVSSSSQSMADSSREPVQRPGDQGSTTPVPAAEANEASSQTGEPSIDAQDIPSKAAARNAHRVATKPGDAILRKFSHAIHAAIQRGDLRDASKHYAELIKVARPDIYVADALMRALCRGSLRAPPRPHVMQALRIYNGLVEAEKQDAAEIKGFFDGTQPVRAERKRIDAGIYNILLRALSVPGSAHIPSRDFGPEVQEEYTRLAMALLADMEARGLRPDNRTVTSILLLRFRGAKDHQEAFGCYRSLLTELETAASSSELTSSDDLPSRTNTPPILDWAGYRVVLNAFGKLSFPGAPVAPAPLWFSIADDMRARGYVVTIEDYTIFLGGILGQKATPLALQGAALGIPSPDGEEDRMRAMYASVKHLHEKLTVDPTFSPDAQLLNTLINAYQHLGAFNDALRVFNIAWLSGRIDHVTPIIIFDACGYAGRQHVASVIWCMLVAQGWQFDKRTLDTWVECLCRSGNVEAACRFVCVYMGREKAGYLSKGDTSPDAQTCLILLKLSWVAGQNAEVKEKLKAHLPHLWDGLAAHYT